MSKLSTLKQEAYKAGKKKNWAQAIMLYEQILELDKNNPTVINELGDLCLKGAETDRAVRYFLSAASKYRTTGLLNNAVAIYKKILRHEAENLNAHWYLAETRAGQGLIVEGENHAVHFLDASDDVSGDIKEIFLKRCQELFNLFPESRVILSRLAQIFNLWSMPLEAARAQALIFCMDFTGGNHDEAKKGMNELTAKTPEVANYPEYAKWNGLLNPGAAGSGGAFSDFGSVELDTGAASSAASPAEEGGSFGDLDIGAAATPAPPGESAHEPAEETATETTTEDEKVIEIPVDDDSAADSPLLRGANPAAAEVDDDGCFSIDADDGGSLDDLVAEAAGDVPAEDPAEEQFTAPPSGLDALLDGPDETPAGGDGAEQGVDLLAQMLEEDGPDLAAEATGQMETITSEIGAVVGGDGEEDADRLYEMGMVYLEMGMFDKACESFETAAADDEFSVRAHEMWGITLQRANRADEAIAVLESGLEFATENSREHHGLLYHLGMAREATGDADAAIECFRSINDVDPTYLDVGKRLARLTAV